MHRCLPLFRTEKYLALHECCPPKAPTWLLSIDVVTNLEQNAMRDIKTKRQGYNREG
jgi:hypothetical protein